MRPFFKFPKALTENFQEIVSDVNEVFNAPVLVGAVAIGLYVEDPISTRDVDFVLEEDDFVKFMSSSLPPLTTKILFRKFKLSPKGENHHLIHLDTEIGVDFVAAFDTTFANREIFERIPTNPEYHQYVKILGKEVKVAKPEVIVCSKLRRIAMDSYSIRSKIYDVHIAQLFRVCQKDNFVCLLPLLNDKEKNVLNQRFKNYEKAKGR